MARRCWEYTSNDAPDERHQIRRSKVQQAGLPAAA